MPKLYRCPICKTDQPASHFSCKSGSQGGKATGPSKARTSEQARAAVATRWAKHKAENPVTGGKSLRK